MIRLDKYLADMQVGTRSQVKEYVRKGRIKVDGEVVKKSDIKIDETSQEVRFDEGIIGYVEYEYYMLNKPAGVLSATTDKNATTVVDLIDSARKDLFPVGRLDKDTEGLLLITNDGKMAHELLSPKKHVNKTYLAHVKGHLPKDAVEIFEKGIELGDFTTMPASLVILEPFDINSDYSGKSIVEENRERGEEVTTVNVTIQEGKFHQVKRMFAALDCEVVYLKRIQMGPIHLDEKLAPGQYEEISGDLLELLKEFGKKLG